MAHHCAIEATAEGMMAHARTATVRTDRYAPVGTLGRSAR